MQARRRAMAGAVQHRRPEQAVEIDDVLADEVMQLGIAACAQVGVEVEAACRAQRLEAGQVADRRVQPDVEVFARRAGDLEAEIGRIARDVPGAQAAFGIQPLAQLGLDPGNGDIAFQPLAQEGLEAADLEEEMLGIAQLGRCAGDDRLRFLEFGRRVGRAAVFAVVAVLVGRAAVRADALDVAVGQEHALVRVVELLHRAMADMAVGLERRVDRFGQRAVARRIGGIVVVEGHAEVGEVALVPGLDIGDEGFRRHACLFGGEHDRRAVGVVGADVVHRVAGHAPRAHPDVGLDIAHQVAEVERAVGVGQGIGDERGAGHREYACGAVGNYCMATKNPGKPGLRMRPAARPTAAPRPAAGR